MLKAARAAGVSPTWLKANIGSACRIGKPGFNASPYRNASKAKLKSLGFPLVGAVAAEILLNPSVAEAAEIGTDWRGSDVQKRLGDAQGKTKVALFSKIISEPEFLNLIGRTEVLFDDPIGKWEDLGMMTAFEAL